MTEIDASPPRYAVAVDRAVVLTQQTMKFFPVRVWRHFLRQNGVLLSAGMSYQGLFALFALLYITFASVGIWLGGSPRAIDMLIDIANSYIPGIIGPDGLAKRADIVEVAQSASSLLALTGAVAIVAALWTAMSAVTYTRRAVRDIFGLPFDSRNFVLLKTYDFAAGLAFGLALLIGAALNVVGVWALTAILDFLGWSLSRGFVAVLVRASSLLVAFVIDAAALAVLVRFLTGTSIRWRTIWPGAWLGGLAIVILQLGAGLLLSHSPTNPLLATFAVVVALLLWCRWVSIVVLMAASWIAVTAEDRDQPIQHEGDDPDGHLAQQRALVWAAHVNVRRAAQAHAEARWWQRPGTRRELARAQEMWRSARTEAEAEGLDVMEFVDSLADAGCVGSAQ